MFDISPDRLLFLAVMVTLFSGFALYQAWLRRQAEAISPRLFVTYAVLLAVGSGMAWLGFFLSRA